MKNRTTTIRRDFAGKQKYSKKLRELLIKINQASEIDLRTLHQVDEDYYQAIKRISVSEAREPQTPTTGGAEKTKIYPA